MDMKFASDSDDIHIEGTKVSDDLSVCFNRKNASLNSSNAGVSTGPHTDHMCAHRRSIQMCLKCKRLTCLMFNVQL